MVKPALSAYFAAAVLMTGTLSGLPTASSQSLPLEIRSPIARASLTPCVDLPALPTAECGTITVDLDRAHPAAGTTTVAFAVIPHTDRSQPSLGAIVPNPGGPGVSTIDYAGPEYAAALAPLLARRDLILMDPRGVGRSEALTCAALSDPARAFGTEETERELVGKCGQELGSRIADYGTAAVADDLDDIRASLGIDKLDLLGDSYGTLLMTTYAQRHPQHVRSIVLSGAYDVHIDGSGELAVAAVRRAVGLVCSRTSECVTSTVLNDFSEVSAALRAHPTSFPLTWQGSTYNVVLDEWQWAGLVSHVYSGAADTDSELALAHAAAAARTGDLAPLEALVTAYLSGTADIYAAGAQVYSDADTWAAVCHDYPRTFDYSDTVPARTAEYDKSVASLKAQDFRPFSPQAWVTRASYDGGICLDWPDDPTAKAPYKLGAKMPAVPVLVLAGDLDANTATPWGRAAAAQFSDATFIEVKGSGHTPTITEQGRALILAFLNHPYR